MKRFLHAYEMHNDVTAPFDVSKSVDRSFAAAAGLTTKVSSMASPMQRMLCGEPAQLWNSKGNAPGE